MRPDVANDLTRRLMREHGLSDWRFEWMRSSVKLGLCSPSRKTISLSRPYTLVNDIDEVRQTILHEIAHALTPGAGHGPRWSHVAREIGVDRAHRSPRVAIPTSPPCKWHAKCSTHGVVGRWYRKPTRSFKCSHCSEKVVVLPGNAALTIA